MDIGKDSRPHGDCRRGFQFFRSGDHTFSTATDQQAWTKRPSYYLGQMVRFGCVMSGKEDAGKIDRCRT
jgi:hypothetical protein